MAKVTIVGAGAIGGITGTHLTLAGVDVILADTWQDHVEALRRGVYVDGARGEYRLPLNAVLPERLEGPLDIVLLAVKSVFTTQALEGIKHLLAPDSVVVSLQNGINEYSIAGLAGADRTIGCMIGWGATSVGPGRLTQTSLGDFHIGRLNGTTGGRLEEVAQILGKVTKTNVTDNILGHLWSKLLNNCVITLGALLGKTVGEAVAPARNKRIIFKVVEEGIKVALARGVRLEKFEGLVDPVTFVPQKPEDEEIAFMLIDILGHKHGLIMSSIYQDIEKGRKSEIEYINGQVVSDGEAAGVPTPVNSAVVRMILEIESGTRRFGESNIEELARIARVEG